MSGITELDELLRSMSPKLVEGEYVFCTVIAAYYHDHIFIQPESAQSAVAALKEFSD